jgi:hypothetical protein
LWRYSLTPTGIEREERMNSDYQVVLTKEDFSFNAAHFIAYEVIYQSIRPYSDALMSEVTSHLISATNC